MDRFETQTELYLRSLEQGEVVYEPHGRDTFPDFSLGGIIGVEVTQLVRPPVGGAGKSVDTLLRPFIDTLKSAIENDDVAAFLMSAFIFVKIRELPSRKKRKETATKLSQMLEGIGREQVFGFGSYEVNEHVSFDVVPSKEKLETQFQLGGVGGSLFSGWVVEDLISKCSHALDRKKSKAKEVVSSFEELWLAVGGAETMSLRMASLNEFVRQFRVESVFRYLILIDGENPSHSMKIALNDP